MRALITLNARLRKLAGDESADERRLERAQVRAIRGGIGSIIGIHASSGLAGDELERWTGWRRRFASCEFVRVLRNGLTGTELGYPYSCRVPGCPHCERERVSDARERYLPLARAARHPIAGTLTMPNVQPGELAGAWTAIGAAWLRVWHSPLFSGERSRRCRPGRIGCLAAVDLEARRACKGRCRRPRPKMSAAVEHWSVHLACRPCRGHEPAAGALLALETTVNRHSSTWHPHANLLIDSPFINRVQLAAAWRLALERELGKLAGEPVTLPAAFVKLREARRPPPGHRGEWSADHALFETVKYAIKPDAELIDSAAPRWFVEWANARHGRRLVRSYGDWYGAELEAEPADELAEQVVDVTDPDSGRVYRAPLLDPLTDELADWQLMPADAPRSRFARYQPERAGARAWVVSHPFAAFDSS